MNPLNLTVLGCAGTMPGPGRACSSYLVEAEGYRLLLDCGNGSMSNLQQVASTAAIDAVVISHLHPDHFVDLYGLYYAWRFDPAGIRSVPVYGPVGTEEHLSQLIHGDPEDVFTKVCRFQTAAPGDHLRLGPFDVRLFAGNHPITTLASRVEYGDRIVAYSADTAGSPEIVACAKEADLFLADCSWLESQRPLPDGVHMTAREAGRHAAAAGVSCLLVTHVFPANSGEAAVAEARTEFGGEVVAVTDLQEFSL